jgi:Ca2+-binding RTX toxin-like protein
VVFGTASGFSASLDLSDLDGTNGFQINGEAADDRASFSVAAAGDVNGDGYDDLIVGAGGADPNGSNSGASYIIFGKATQATTGDDELTGAGGAETISGLDGDDTLLGMAGNDQLFGGADNDSLGGGAGNDSLDGGANNDTLIGAAGADTIIGATGNDSLDGGAGDDSITGGSGSDTIIGEVGNDTVDGGAGADRLSGGSGSDTMIGGGDNDTITGGAGRDVLTGGLNNDVFKFTAMNEMTLSEATTDRITDFKRGQDKIDLSAIDASTVLTTDDAFIFRGSKEFKENNAGEINFKKFDNKGTTKAQPTITRWSTSTPTQTARRKA